VDAEDLEKLTIAGAQRRMTAGQLTSGELVRAYIERIDALDRQGPTLRSYLEIAADAKAVAAGLDAERAAGRIRGPLHGIPLVLKDNIDTTGMMTTAGSLALVGPPPERDATVAARLREAGAVFLGKANMSEWANFRSTRSSSGWSGRGGQGRNPFVLDRTPCGSSSGSATAVAASLAAGSLGTETNGSIACPASVCGVVGVKPTVGLTSRAGVIPISATQDSVGPICRTVEDAAMVLDAIAGPDPRDPATAASEGHALTDYSSHLSREALSGARIGVARQYFGVQEHADRVAEEALGVLRDLGAVLIDPVEIPTLDEIRKRPNLLMLYEFKAGVNDYLRTRTGLGVTSLTDLIAFNQEHEREEMPFFRQELWEQSEAKGSLDQPEYLEARASGLKLAREAGLDHVLAEHDLDAIVAPTRGPAWTIDLLNGDRGVGASSGVAAVAGYPLVTVPAGFAFDHLAIGISFIGTAWSEARLLGFAYAFEAASSSWRPPRFLPSLELAD
jgi:amidase